MESETTGTSGKRILVIGLIAILAIVLIGAGLVMAFGDQLGLGGGDGESNATADTVPASSEAENSEVATTGALAVTSAENVRVDAWPADQFAAEADWEAAAAALPGSPEGDVFTLDSRADNNSGSLQLALPGGTMAARTADVHGWDGAQWVFLPGEQDGDTWVSAEGVLPQAVAVISAEKPADPIVGAEILPEQQLPDATRPLLSNVTVGTLTLGPDGLLTGRAAEVPPGGYRQFLRATNTGAIIDQESLTSLMSNPSAQATQVSRLTQAAFDNGFAGINIDYQGNAPEYRDQFTGYLRDLNAALDAQDLDLIVTLAGPQELPTGEVVMGGYDWPAIGEVADAVVVQMPLNPTAYDDGGEADQDLAWVVRQVPRNKLVALYTTNAIDKVGESYRELPTGKALVNFGDVQVVEGDDTVEVNQSVTLGLSGDAGELVWDGVARTYQYNYTQANQPHTVWLHNSAALAHRLRLADQYNLAGIGLRGLTAATAPDGQVDAINSYLGQGPVPDPAAAAIVWQVEDADGNVLTSEAGSDLFTYEWPGAAEDGIYSIKANFALGESLSTLGVYNVRVDDPAAVAEAPEEEDTTAEEAAEEESAETETEDAVDAESTEDAGDESAATTAPAGGSGGGIMTTIVNFREGPGLSYPVIRPLETNERILIVGKDRTGFWFKVLDTEGAGGWVYAELVQLDGDVDVAALEVASAPPPPAAPATAPPAGGDSGGDAGSAAAPPAPAPIVPPTANVGNFELGGQAFGSPYGQMSYSGMTWIKRQHKWGPGNTGNEVAAAIQDAHANGFKILLSMPGPRYPSSINFQEYIQFLSNVASLPDPPDAIEVWNEQNIDAEWPVGQIDPTAYVNNMLAPAYNAIKAANPNIMVISGAPAPTGFFGGCSPNGCDDAVYVAAMAAAGAANYTDCIGIHYNEGIIPPSQQSGDPRSEHYTRYFWGMTNAYYNAFGGSRPLCYTELGYLSGEGYGGLPGGFAWAGNVTVGQQAQWLAEATSLAANSGKVRMLIVWNIDSTTWGDDPQAGYAIIRPGGGCPACDALSQVMN